jgi:hypothetical protein
MNDHDPACPVGPADRTGVVKNFAFLGLEPRLNIKYGFNWAGKIRHFSKVSAFCFELRKSFLKSREKIGHQRDTHRSETFAKRSFLPNFCVRLKF